jgi:hypothetical protein
MAERPTPHIEKEDIRAPRLSAGGTSVVLQRHEEYERNTSAENAGSITRDDAYTTDRAFFDDIFAQEVEGGPQAMVLITASDTRYAGKGYRSIETGELALAAAADALRERGIDPATRIINVNPDFTTNHFEPTGADVRPIHRLREPQLFDADAADYYNHLLTKYGDAETGVLSTAAWAAHEADTEKAVREAYGAEGVHDIIDRTKKSLAVFGEYARRFHQTNPRSHLIIWAGTHYDTISPLVKDATGTPLEDYVPVAHGGGVVVDLPPNQEDAVLQLGREEVIIHLGRHALK